MRLDALAGRGLASKGFLAAGMLGAAVAMLLLSGCSVTDDEARARLDDLETRIGAIEGRLDEGVDGVVDGIDVDKTFSTTDSYASYVAYLEDIDKRVADAAAAADKAAVPGDAEKVPLAYQQAVTPLEDLQDELGHLEDAFEVAGGSGGTITSEEFASLKATADALNADIDSAIGNVKDRFGM